MNENQIVITPHPGQAKVLTSSKRFILAAAGIQSGKTWCGCIWSQLEIQKHPDGVGLIAGLSHDQVSNVIEEKFFTLFPGYKQYFNKKDRTIYLPTDGKVFFRSMEDPKYVEGITANWEWIDEADLVGYHGYVIGRGRVSATGGRMLLTSSISDNSWIAEYFERLDPKEFDIVTWESRMNPAFTKEEWESLEHEMDPVLFRRRYMAELSFASGRVYGNFDVKKHTVDKIPDNDPVEKVFLGFDWGYNDPTAIIVIGLSEKKNIYIIEDFMVEGIVMDVILGIIRKFRESYDPTAYYGDPSNKILLRSISQSAGITILPGNNDIFSGTGLIRNLIFQDRFFVLKRCVHVLQELRRYRFKEGLVGRTEEPEDKNNHTLDAIRMVLATYPIPQLRYNKKAVVDETPKTAFWARRTPAYQRELRRQKRRIIGTGQFI